MSDTHETPIGFPEHDMERYEKHFHNEDQEGLGVTRRCLLSENISLILTCFQDSFPRLADVNRVELRHYLADRLARGLAEQQAPFEL